MANYHASSRPQSTGVSSTPAADKLAPHLQYQYHPHHQQQQPQQQQQQQFQPGSGMAGLAALSNFGIGRMTGGVSFGGNNNINIGSNGGNGMMTGMSGIMSGYGIPISNSRPGSRRNSSDEGTPLHSSMGAGGGGGEEDGGGDGHSHGMNMEGNLDARGWSRSVATPSSNGGSSMNAQQQHLQNQSFLGLGRGQLGPSQTSGYTAAHRPGQLLPNNNNYYPTSSTQGQQRVGQIQSHTQPSRGPNGTEMATGRGGVSSGSISGSLGDSESEVEEEGFDEDEEDEDAEEEDDSPSGPVAVPLARNKARPRWSGGYVETNPALGSTTPPTTGAGSTVGRRESAQSRRKRPSSTDDLNALKPSASTNRRLSSRRKSSVSHGTALDQDGGDAEVNMDAEGEMDGDDPEGEGDDGEEDDPDGGLDADGRPKKKQKLTRGSRACTVCRRLKMKCIEPDPEGGKPCKRCRNGNQECIFEESMRGKKSTRRKKLPDGSTPPPKTSNRKHDGASRADGAGSHHDSPAMSNFRDRSNMANGTLSPMGPPSLPIPVKQEEMYLPSSAEKASLEKYHVRKPKPGIFGSQTLSKLLSEAPSLPEASPLPESDYGFAHGHSAQMHLGTPSSGTSSQVSGDQHLAYSGGSPAMELSSLVSRTPASPRLDSLPDDSLNPLGLLAEASLHNSSRKRSMNMQASPAESSRQALARTLSTQAEAQVQMQRSTSGRLGSCTVLEGSAVTDDEELAPEPRPMGVGDEHYFKPGPMTIVPLRKVFIGKEVQPEMLTFVNNEEVQELFDIYFDHLHIHVPVLDRSFHTPSTVCARSPFLMTVVCAIASRFYSKRPELQARLSTCANSLIFDVPMRGYKSVEVVQAYLLLTNFCLGPPERFEQDRTWLLLGLALRIATDLNLQRKMPFSGDDTELGRTHDREVLNRERTWLVCFSSDRSYSAQMGKPYTIKEDYITRNCTSLAWQSHPLVSPSDVAIANYCTVQRIMSRALDTLYSNSANPSGLLTDCDIPMIIEGFQTQLDAWSQSWLTPDSHPKRRSAQVAYNISGRFYYHYNSLVLSSFGLQNALIKSPTDVMLYFTKVYSSASAVCDITLKETAPRNLLTYGSDAHFVMGSYAILSLLKLIRPEFRSLHNRQAAILDLVSRVVDAMSDAAADPYHTPALYATLLRSFIASKAEEIRAEAMNQAPATSYGSVDPTDLSRPGLHGQPKDKPTGYPVASEDAANPQTGFTDPFQFSGMNGSTLGNWPSLTSASASATPFAQQGQQDFFTSLMPASPASRATQANTPFGGASVAQNVQTNGSAFPAGMSMDDYGTALGMEEFGNWDSSFLMPGLGLGQPELSGGLIHGAWGSGFISPNFGMTPSQSVQATPRASPRLGATQFGQR